MRGRLPESSKIAWRVDKTVSKVVHPNPIDKYSGGERVLWIDDPLSQLCSTTPLMKNTGIRMGKDPRKTSGCNITGWGTEGAVVAMDMMEDATDCEWERTAPIQELAYAPVPVERFLTEPAGH